MISNAAINTNSFVYCLTYFSSHESAEYFNQNLGHYHSVIYLLEGTMDVVVDGEELAPLQPGIVYDISHTKGKTVKTSTGSSGASMVMFNPIPEDKKLNVEVVKDSQVLELNATSRTTIICLTGPVEVNGKTLKTNQYAVVFTNKSATLTMKDNTVCAIVTE